jgi:hypothetical protein
LEAGLVGEQLGGSQVHRAGLDGGQFGLLVLCGQALLERSLVPGRAEPQGDARADPLGDRGLGGVESEAAEGGVADGFDHDAGCFQWSVSGVPSPYLAPEPSASPACRTGDHFRVARGRKRRREF